MKTALLLQLPDGRYLADDFETWVENIEETAQKIVAMRQRKRNT